MTTWRGNGRIIDHSPLQIVSNILLAFVAIILVFDVVLYFYHRGTARREKFAAGGFASSLGTLALVAAVSAPDDSGIVAPLAVVAVIATAVSFYFTYRSISDRP